MRTVAASIVLLLCGAAHAAPQNGRLVITSSQVSGGLSRKAQPVLRRMDALYKRSGDKVGEVQGYAPSTQTGKTGDATFTIRTMTTDLRQHVAGDYATQDSKVNANLLSARGKKTISVSVHAVDQRTPGVTRTESISVSEKRGRVSMTREIETNVTKEDTGGWNGERSRRTDRSFFGGLFGISTDHVRKSVMQPNERSSSDTENGGRRYLTLFGARVLPIGAAR